MLTQLTINKICDWDGMWRVDWFGDLSYPDLNQRQSQPSVAVQFSQNLSSSCDIKKREEWLPIGLLPLLKVGDLWQHGQPTGENTAPSRETFSQLAINRDSTQFYKAGGKPDPKTHGLLGSIHYWLPLDQHPWHREHTHANCVVITVSRVLQILIPCMELIRFYFGSSSSLLSTLFRPMLSRTNLAKQYIKRADDSVFLRLAEGISGASAADIARIIYSPAAWQAASLIGKSALQCSSIGERIYPKCAFPFEGITDLNVTGQWITHDGSTRKIFIVYEIISCAHEFPFKSIRYVTTGNSSKFKASGSINRPSSQKSKHYEDNTIVLKDSDPDEKRQTRHVQFISASSRFPDLETKTIFRNPSFSIPKDQPYSAAPPGSFSVGATGQGKGITPVEIESGIIPQHFDITELPDFFQTGLATLQHALSFTLMTPYTHATYTLPVPLIRDASNSPYNNCFTHDGDGRPKRRLMGCVQVDYANHVEGTIILEPICGDMPEVVSFELSEEFFDLNLVKKHLRVYWGEQTELTT
ncbi:hypothetical protein HB854_00800 [Aeromonas caviae]|uniref:hypothetical protein n=2 Tax=Aeromonas caviae TaxID=648 RepID=UPI002B46FD0D|nr:hypothetical protein [Aeromonas caviae]MCK2069270.1 hypothetical protein [Aeromonas caviae]